MNIFYDIRDFGAIGDGRTINTSAIQSAIDQCCAAGGGEVVIAGGRYVTGTIYLKDNVSLNIVGGAVLFGSTNIADYATDTYKIMYKNEPYLDESKPYMDRCLIFARNAKSIAICGFGVIDGQGQWKNFPNKDDPQKNRPMIIRFLDCANIRVRDVTIQNPAGWASAWLYCSDIVVSGIRIHSRPVGGNGDGLDFDGCHDVRVSNCSFDTSDDSVCLQTSRPDVPCRNVVIDNCIFSSKWAGVCIGLLSRGDFENVAISNCVFDDCEAGLRIQMCEGGEMKNMLFANLVMKKVMRPVFMVFCQQRACVDAPAEVVPMKAMRSFVFNGMLVDSSACGKDSAIVITGLPGHPIENVSLSGIRMTSGGGGTGKEGSVQSLPEYTLKNLEGWWPEYKILGTVPCYGIYARHVKGLAVHDAKVIPAKRDARPAIVCDDVFDLDLAGIHASADPDAESLIRLQNVCQATVRDCRVQGKCKVFVRLEGEHTDDISLAADNLCRSDKIVSCGDKVKRSAVSNLSRIIHDSK